MRSVVFFVCLLTFSAASFAQYAGYTLVSDTRFFQSSLAEAAAKTNTIASDFVQEKNLSLLSEKIVSRGKFWFKKNNRIRMEYTTPFEYLMVINNDKVTIRDGQKTNSVSVASNRLFQQINKIMIDCVRGTALQNTDFHTRVFENKTGYLIELDPVSKSLKDLFKTILVSIDKKDESVSSINMTELSGDNTLIRFTGRQMNTNIPDAVFTVR
jgi:outer membrane lipoprotein-sorting protein